MKLVGIVAAFLLGTSTAFACDSRQAEKEFIFDAIRTLRNQGSQHIVDIKVGSSSVAQADGSIAIDVSAMVFTENRGAVVVSGLVTNNCSVGSLKFTTIKDFQL